MQTVKDVSKTDMSNQTSRGIKLTCMTDAEVARVAKFIDEQVGIQLPASKRTLVEGRLRKRMQVLGYKTFSEYLEFVLEAFDGQDERFQLIDVITTNKTNFFREPKHFDYLISDALPTRVEEIYSHKDVQGLRPVHVWSAGCSSGEEPYTLSMVMNEAKETGLRFQFDILATDISQKCLKTASQAVYSEYKIEPVPMALRRKYLLRSRKAVDGLIQIGPKIRQQVKFDVCNLMDRTFKVKEKMDIIFCRNVMIYFDNETKMQLVDKFEEQLLPGGYLFVGHSESLSGMKTKLKQVSPMVYQKDS